MNKIKLLKLLKEMDGEDSPESSVMLDLWREIQTIKGSIPEKTDLGPLLKAHGDFAEALDKIRKDALSAEKLKDIDLDLTYSRTKIGELEGFRAKMVETLDDVDKRISGKVTAKDLEEVRIKLLSMIASNTGGGNANRDEKVDGANVLRPFTDINWIAGSGITIDAVANQTTKYTDITITSTGGGGGMELTPESPSGTVNDSNVTFTVSNEPLYIVVNGATYKVGQGLYASYSGGAITLSSPVGTGGFIQSWYNATGTAQLTPETPSGTINDSNVTFTVSHEPLYIDVNGAQYRVGQGIYASYLAGTITLSSPVGTGGFITSWYNS